MVDDKRRGEVKSIRTYYGEPYDANYYFGSHQAGYTDYADYGDPANVRSQVIVNRADDIETETGLVTGKNVLVIACAFGYLVNELVSRGADVLGLDISSYAIGQAETLFPTLDFTTADILSSGLKKNDYDLIIGNGIIMCMPDGNTLDLLMEELYDLVKPTGAFYGLSDVTPHYYYVINNSELIVKFENWFGSGIATITDTGHLPLAADRRIVVG